MQGTRVRGGPRCWRLSLACAALALAAAAALFPSSAESAPAGAISMNPASSSPDVGDYVSLTIDLTGAVDLHEVRLAMTYNPAIVQVVDADLGTPGVQILPGNFPGNASNGDVLENSAASGVIHYHYELNGASEAAGDGTVATVQFLALANGNAEIAWGAHLLSDASGSTVTAAATPAMIVVGGPAPTVTPAVTDTPGPPAPTSTSAPPTVTRTPSPTRTHTPTRTPTVAGPPPASQVEATATPRVTVLQNSNLGTATPRPRTGGVDPDQSARADGLPSAGNDGPAIQWWRWSFFVAALMLGVAGWFFTFAMHHGDRDVVLTDRFDRRRRRR